MPAPVLATKLYIPPPRPKAVPRPRLIERLNEGLSSGRRLTLISAPAGFGKTTLVSDWVANLRLGGAKESQIVNRKSKIENQVAWLSLDKGDNDLTRFLTYLVAALQTIEANIGAGILNVLQSPQPPSTESILTALLNEIATVPNNFILILDDYHAIDSKPVDQALNFLLEYQPPQMHLVIATREDPSLLLPRLRARGQLTELRAADLRFTPAEAAEFLNRVMSLNLSAEDVAALEARTEGWIAGLQMAAISMQRLSDTTSFIRSFTGSHHFVLDYLVEEVLHQQPESIQIFLLRTSILDRLCGPLCDAVVFDPAVSGQSTLEYLERANLFIVPLDNERHWYRYHHLFGELLRKRLGQSLAPEGVAELHIRASEWYENNDLMLEAFHHAAAANDIERAVRLMESKGMHLDLPGAATAVLNWLESLPTTVLNACPALWWKQAEVLLTSGQTMGVEEKLQATEAALAAATLPSTEANDQTRDLIGKIATVRSNLALTQHQAETMLAQARRALEYLHPNNLSYRSSATRDMGYAYYLLGDRAAAGRIFAEALSIAQASGDTTEPLLATVSLARIQELENQLYLAAESYQSVLQQVNNYSPSNVGVVYFGLAQIYYEWNDLDAAEQYGEQSLQLARQYNQIIDRFIMSGVFLVRLKLARGDVSGAAELLAQVEQSARQHNFIHRMPEVVAVQVLILLRQGDLAAAAHLAQTHELPISQARVYLAQGDPSAALAVLESLRQQVEAKNWQDEQLKVMVLQAVALHAHGEKDKAVQLLSEALALAEPGGFIRLFVDEGAPMAELLSTVAAQGIKPDYVNKLLATFDVETKKDERPTVSVLSPSALVEPLTPRELEVLQLIADGLSNQEIGARLFLALDTVKGHNRRIFDKLQVQRRTEAIARAHELGLL
jgi:LuxR family maltose regulon positive regulatory protein